MEFDLQLQCEDLLRIGDVNKAVRDVNELAWKGGGEDNPDYECLRAEIRKMAPSNRRAVLLFRDKCGCPISKLEGWALGTTGITRIFLTGFKDTWNNFQMEDFLKERILFLTIGFQLEV